MTKTTKQVVAEALGIHADHPDMWDLEARDVVNALREAGMLREPGEPSVEQIRQDSERLRQIAEWLWMDLEHEETGKRLNLIADRHEQLATSDARPVIDREKLIDVLVMTDLSDFAGTDMGLINQCADAVIAHLDADTGDDGTAWEKTYSYGCMKVEHDGFECLMNYGANVVAAEQCARSCGGKLMRRTAMFGEWEEMWPCSTIQALDGAPEPAGACGAGWDCPPSEYHDTSGFFTCALPAGHGGPHVDAKDGVRWNHDGFKHPDLGTFTAPGGLPVEGESK